MKKHLTILITLLAAWINSEAAPQLATGFVKREVFLNTVAG